MLAGVAGAAAVTLIDGNAAAKETTAAPVAGPVDPTRVQGGPLSEVGARAPHEQPRRYVSDGPSLAAARVDPTRLAARSQVVIRSAGQEAAIQDVRVLYRKAVERAVELLDEWNVEHELADKRVVPRCWRTTDASARVQTLDHGAPIAMGTVWVEMGHKSLYMLTRVYERIGEVRARREVVEYGRPDGRLPGEDLQRSVLGYRFDEIVRSEERRPTLRAVG